MAALLAQLGVLAGHVLAEVPEIPLTDATNGVDISTGAIVLGQVSIETGGLRIGYRTMEWVFDLYIPEREENEE